MLAGGASTAPRALRTGRNPSVHTEIGFAFVRKRGDALDVGAALCLSGESLRAALPYSRILPEHDCLSVRIVGGIDYVGACTLEEAIRYFRAMEFLSVDEPHSGLRDAGITADDVESGRGFLAAQLRPPPQQEQPESRPPSSTLAARARSGGA